MTYLLATLGFLTLAAFVTGLVLEVRDVIRRSDLPDDLDNYGNVEK